MRLDQFYTKPEIARRCLTKAKPVLERLAGRKAFYIEPSAGDGVFYKLLPKSRRVGFDIEPHHPEVMRRDFLKLRYKAPVDKPHTVVIGNPPFGLRGTQALAFFNKAFSLADTVAFIVPVIFRKHFIHRRMPTDARWIHTTTLPRNAFRTSDKDEYSVNTEFQIWTRVPSRHKNRRIFSPPPISHPDFIMHQYNNTEEALKVFKEEFDLAIPCQGYQDYGRRETNPSRCEKTKQWLLFKAKSRKVLDRLKKIDYATLATKHTTSTPGFRKGDVVREYSELYDPTYLRPVQTHTEQQTLVFG